MKKPTAGFWTQLWARWFGSSEESPDRARLSFLLQQQEGELQTLKAILLDAQTTLKRAEDERQKWSDVLNQREVELEKERTRSALSGEALRDVDDQLRKLRRDKLHQQRSYEDRIHDLVEKLGDLRQGVALVPPPSGPGDQKAWLLEKRGLEEQIEEQQDKVLLAEERLSKERFDRLEVEKQIVASKNAFAALQEKLRNTESQLWTERSRHEEQERERARLQQSLAEMEKQFHEFKHESQSQDPSELPQELIALRNRVQELEEVQGGVENLVPGDQEPWRREMAARREAEARVASLTQELNALRLTLERERARWLEERGRLLAEWDKEKKREAEDRRAHEDRADTLSLEISTLQITLDREQRKWQEERQGLQEEWKKEKKEWAARQAALQKDLAAARVLPPPPPAPPSSGDVERLMKEVDELLALNAGLNDEIAFLKEKRNKS